MTLEFGASATSLSIVGIWNWDVRTDLVVICTRVAEYYNISAETGLHGVAMHRLVAAIDPHDVPVFQRKLIASHKDGADFDAIYAIESELHGRRTVRATGQCFAGRDGAPAYVSGILIDNEHTRREHERLMQTIDLLIRARETARQTNQPTLVELIEAILLHATRLLADISTEQSDH